MCSGRVKMRYGWLTVEKLVKEFIGDMLDNYDHPYCKNIRTGWRDRVCEPEGWMAKDDVENFLMPMLEKLSFVEIKNFEWLAQSAMTLYDAVIEAGLRDCDATELSAFFDKKGRVMMRKWVALLDLVAHTKKKQDERAENPKDGHPRFMWILPNYFENHFNLLVLDFFEASANVVYFDSLYGMGNDVQEKTEALEWIARVVARCESVSFYNCSRPGVQERGQCGPFVCLYALLYASNVDENWIKSKVKPCHATWIRTVIFDHFLKMERRHTLSRNPARQPMSKRTRAQ